MDAYSTATARALLAEQAAYSGLTPTRIALGRWLHRAAGVGRFILHFLEMLVVMMVGMAPYMAYVKASSPPYAAWFARGTYAYSLGMALSMALPMAPWMKLRGHGWRPGTEMALAMVLPTVVVVLLRVLGLDQAHPWIRNADGPGMFLAMLGVMLYRREHYTGGHSQHGQHGHDDEPARHADHEACELPTGPSPAEGDRPSASRPPAAVVFSRADAPSRRRHRR